MPGGSKGTADAQGRHREDPREKNTKCAACGRVGHWRGDTTCEKEQEHGKSQVGKVQEDHVIECFLFTGKGPCQ